MATLFVDPLNGNDSLDGLSFANRKKTIGTVMNSANAGDVIRVMQSPDPTLIGNCDWVNNWTITLPPNTTRDIYNDGSWTAAANVTAALNTTLRKVGTNCAQLTFGAGFTTGKAAHYALPATVNASAYTKVSFWIYTNTSLADGSIFTLNLCSDANGDVPVASMVFPVMPLSAARHTPITLDFGAALPSNINSLSLHTTADPGTPIIYIDNMFATNGIALNTMFGMNRDSEDTWYAPRSILANEITIDQGNTQMTVGAKGYIGSTEMAVPTYFQEGFAIPGAFGTATLWNITKAGASGSPITLSGGWNRSDMTSRVGKTWLNAQNMSANVIALASNMNFWTFEDLGVYNANQGFTLAASDIVCTRVHVVGTVNSAFIHSGTRFRQTYNACKAVCIGSGFASSAAMSKYTDCVSLHCNNYGWSQGATASGTYLKNCEASGCANFGFYFNGMGNVTLEDCYARRDTTAAFNLLDCGTLTMINCEAHDSTSGVAVNRCAGTRILGLTTSGNVSGGINSAGVAGGEISITNWVHTDPTAVVNLNDYDDALFVSVNDNGVSGVHKIYTDGGLIESITDTLYGSSGRAWKMSVTSAARTIDYPLRQPIRFIPCKAGVETTVTIQMRRSSTVIRGGVRIVRNQIGGLDETLEEFTYEGADTWEAIAFSFTPTQDGFVTLEAFAYGGTTHHVIWDEVVVSAASFNDYSKGDYASAVIGAVIGAPPVIEGGGDPGGETGGNTYSRARTIP